MSRITTTYCDRCGKEVTLKWKVVASVKAILFEREICRDLCNECSIALYEFLEGKENGEAKCCDKCRWFEHGFCKALMYRNHSGVHTDPFDSCFSFQRRIEKE